MEYLTNINNIQDLYKVNRNKNFENYEKYLSYYYQKPNNKDSYIRNRENKKYILQEVKNPKKKIIIEPAVYVNLFDLYKNLKLYNEIILDKVSLLIEKPQNIDANDREYFDELINNYKIYNKKIQEIDELNKEHFKEIEKLIEYKIENTILMAKYYNERNLVFKKINSTIEKSSKDKIIKKFNENKNKIPDQSEINKTAKLLDIPSNEVQTWFEWIEKCFQYLTARKIVYETITNINKITKEFEYKCENFIIKKPTLEN